MKKRSTTLFADMSTETLDNLASVVKETLAIDFHQKKSKVFAVADLWNIQRQGKSRVQRSLFF